MPNAGYFDLHALLRSHAGGEPLLACAYGLPYELNRSLGYEILLKIVGFVASVSGGSRVYDRGWGIGLTAHTLVTASVHRYLPTFAFSMELRCNAVVHHALMGCELYTGTTRAKESWLRLPGMPPDVAARFGAMSEFPDNVAIGHDLVARVRAARERATRLR